MTVRKTTPQNHGQHSPVGRHDDALPCRISLRNRDVFDLLARVMSSAPMTGPIPIPVRTVDGRIEDLRRALNTTARSAPAPRAGEAGARFSGQRGEPDSHGDYLNRAHRRRPTPKTRSWA